MDNENIEQELQAGEIQQEQPEGSSGAEQSADSVQPEEIHTLRAEVAELRIKLALLTGGAAPEKLDEGVKLAAGLMEADGTEPDDAAAEVLREYPHIRLVKRSVPQFSAESRGSSDGFAAIRSIFARK